MQYFTINGCEHEVGNSRCNECFRNFPGSCVCSGLIHAQFVKESWDNQLELSFACDKCGSNFKFPGQKPRKPQKFATRRRLGKHK